MERGEVSTLIDKIGVEHVEELLPWSAAACDALGAVYSSVIIESWASFEVLASDLWVVAVDNGPTDVANNVAISNALLGGDEQISPKTIKTIEFDVRRNYGSFLRETQKVSFQKLPHIKTFYAVAFGKSVLRLFDDVADGYIHALSALRNVLLHKAGKADKKFVKAVERFPDLRSIKDGDEIELSGSVVRKTRAAAIQMGRNLIQFVDDILSPQRPT